MNKKYILYIVAFIILVGVVIAFALGFNKDTEYGKYTRILVYMTDDTNIDDMQEIIKAVTNEKYEIGFADEFSDAISIKFKSISEEEINNLIYEIELKYNIDMDKGDIAVINTGDAKIYDLLKVYIKPIIISFAITIMLLAIIYRKQGIIKAIVKPFVGILLINAVYFSILAITRIPIGSYTISFRSVYLYN